MQLGVRNDEAAAKAEAAGIEVVMNRCRRSSSAPRRRTVLERRQLGHHSQPRGRGPHRRGKKRRALPGPNLTYGFETRAIHAGTAPDPTTGARITPIFQTAAYVFDDVDHAASLFNLHNFGYIYGRLTNPTVSVLEERVASLEGGRAAVAAASGHAAQFLIFATMLEPGDEFVASRNLYGGSLTQFGLSFKKLGWTAISSIRATREFPQGADAALQGDLHREPRQPRRRGGRPQARGEKSRTRPACR